MSKKNAFHTHGNHGQEQDIGGNYSSYQHNNNQDFGGVGGNGGCRRKGGGGGKGGGVGGGSRKGGGGGKSGGAGGGGGRKGRSGYDRNDNNGRNRKAHLIWTSDNAGSNWTANNYNKQSRFPKFRESYQQQYRGTRDMREYSRNQTTHFDHYDHQTVTQQNVSTQQTPATQQNVTAHQMPAPQQNVTAHQTPASQQNVTALQTPADETKMSESTTIKPTIVKDLTTENTALGNSSASNIGESALTELRKEDSLPLRFPMETIENRVSKIKVEKVEPYESIQQPKLEPQPKPKPQHKSSSSSSSSSDNEVKCGKKQQVEAQKPAAQKHIKQNADDKKIKSKKIEHKLKKSSESVSRPKPDSSSSPDEEETSSEAESSSSEEHTPPTKNAAVTNKPVKKVKKEKKLKTGRKINSDEDVVCLGKAKNKFFLDDEEPDSDATSSKSKNTTDTCILCDKKGHTSFECQMICKNCTKPYHNLKNCPLPANMSLMMQHFMEFLMQQMVKFNPRAAYPFDHLRTNGSSFENAPPSQLLPPGSPAVSSIYGKRKRSQGVAKFVESITKKPSKKRRTLKNNKKDIVSDEFSSASASESETSSDATSDTYKRKNSKTTKQDQSFVSPFPGQLAMPAYSGLPGYGAAAAFNPMLPMLNQMMQNGYPVHGAFNFKQ